MRSRAQQWTLPSAPHTWPFVFFFSPKYLILNTMVAPIGGSQEWRRIQFLHNIQPPYKGTSPLYLSTRHQPCVYACSATSAVSDLTTPWTTARQAPLVIGYPRQEYWSGLPFPTPEDLPNSGIESMPLASPVSFCIDR